MSTTQTPDLERALSVLGRAVPSLVAVYLFGSSSSGHATPSSDIDLAVLAREAVDPLVRFHGAQDVAQAVGRDVDLIDLRSASPVMAMQVLASGRVLLDLDPVARGAFEDRVFGAYARLNEERRGILERVKAEGTVYGR